jgi:hypothetical protein
MMKKKYLNIRKGVVAIFPSLSLQFSLSLIPFYIYNVYTRV